MVDSLTELVSASPWTYAVVFGVALLDVAVVVIPSESVVILAGVLSAAGDLLIPLVVLCAAAGAFCGDGLVYLLGRKTGACLTGRLAGKLRHRLDWARAQLTERGGLIILVARFIPGGRTAVSLTCGTLKMRWQRFVRYEVIAALTWAAYAALLGYIGGRAFEREPWKGLLVAFGAAVLITASTEAYRRLRRDRNATV